MVGEETSEEFDEGSAQQVPACPGQEDEGEVGLVVPGHLTEVEDDGAHCCHHAPVECEQQRVGGEVDVSQLHHQSIIITIPPSSISTPTLPYHTHYFNAIST